MKRFVMIAAVLAAGILGCSEARDVTAPRGVTPAGASFDTQLDCQLDPTVCQKIQAGINYLKVHVNPTCKNIGNGAQSIYDAPSGMGYRFGNDPAYDGVFDMYVNMGPGGGTLSGYQRTDGYVNVTNQWINNPLSNNAQSTGGLLAHEFGGHWTGEDGPNHNTGQSDWLQDICGEA